MREEVEEVEESPAFHCLHREKNLTNLTIPSKLSSLNPEIMGTPTANSRGQVFESTRQNLTNRLNTADVAA